MGQVSFLLLLPVTVDRSIEFFWFDGLHLCGLSTRDSKSMEFIRDHQYCVDFCVASFIHLHGRASPFCSHRAMKLQIPTVLLSNYPLFVARIATTYDCDRRETESTHLQHFSLRGTFHDSINQGNAIRMIAETFLLLFFRPRDEDRSETKRRHEPRWKNVFLRKRHYDRCIPSLNTPKYPQRPVLSSVN